VPHFWLLALRYAGEYAHAGLPTPLSVLSPRQVGRLTFTWIAATAAATLSLPLFGITDSPALYLGLIPAASWLAWSGTVLLGRLPLDLSYTTLFAKVNGYLMAVLVIITAFHLLEPH
jgi:heme O synthase-like polyprenyltransferase